jgi:uncharacterized repeat protein (TIGR03803 family)
MRERGPSHQCNQESWRTAAPKARYGDSITRISSLLLCGLVCASCSRLSGALPLPAQSTGEDAAPLKTGYERLYSFTGAPGGSGPAGVTDAKGLLYGTTIDGGAKSFGSVFERGSSGKVQTIYSFQGGTDGAEPEGSLATLNGVFYGTTEYGGAHSDGTVFAVSALGNERVVYAFEGGNDGATPLLAGLTVVDAALYGTTNAGGDPKCHYEDIVGCGTVFAVSTSGKERVLYRFTGKPDGACPSGTLIAVNGSLYGVTNFGGKYDDGTIFEITTAGVEKTLYSFKGYPDGEMPFAGLVASSGTFYGTTTLGGAFQGAGTVFQFDASGERVLHSFKGAPDGALPYAPLVMRDGILYGTTEDGGSSGRACIGNGEVGCGTIFSVTTSATERVLYQFKGGADGANPWTGLVGGSTTFFGTTLAGGAKNKGTIFQIAL